jgi:hypothetical protein
LRCHAADGEEEHDDDRPAGRDKDEKHARQSFTDRAWKVQYVFPGVRSHTRMPRRKSLVASSASPAHGANLIGGMGVAILDVDGTLVDTNYQHALACYRALG